LLIDSANFPVENPEDEEEKEFELLDRFSKLEITESKANEAMFNADDDEYVYFIQQPKKKLILNYEICSHTMFKEDFHDCLCVGKMSSLF